MRSVGSTLNAKGLGAHDHLSWPYDDRRDFCCRVREFLTDGLALGLQCVYAADLPIELIVEDLAGMPELQCHIARGALVLRVFSELYPSDAAVDPDAMLASFSAATEEALAQGYAGLRVAADATPVLRSPEQLDAFVAWENKVDRYMTGQAFSALCGFERAALPASAGLALACTHPLVREGVTPFQVCASDRGADLAMVGELDFTVIDDLRECLDRTDLLSTPEVVIDGTRLRFVDHRGLECLRDLAARYGAIAVLRTSSPTPGRLVELLGLRGIRVEEAEVVGA